MVTKKSLIESFKTKKFIIKTQSHKFYGVVRKAELIQSNAIRFEGGSWLYFSDIKSNNITDKGFKISDLMGGFIEYEVAL